MTTDPQPSASSLHSFGDAFDALITQLCDTREAYRQAQIHIDNISLSARFRNSAEIRDGFVSAISEILARRGLSVNISSTMSEAFRETWQDLLDLLNLADNDKILTKARDLDQATLDRYDAILGKNSALPDELEDALTFQRNRIKDDVRILTEALEA